MRQASDTRMDKLPGPQYIGTQDSDQAASKHAYFMNLFIRITQVILATTFAVCLHPAYCDVQLPRTISNGMVLQRSADTAVWGRADPGEKVKISFRNKTYSTTTGSSHEWRVQLKQLQAGGPYEMKITGNNTIVLKDVYVGDVWVCSGQSNMELPMDWVRERYEDEIADSGNPEIRHFAVPKEYDFKTPRDDLSGGKWEPANPKTVPGFTAVGYFFARSLYKQYKVPIGLVNATLGGSPVEAWMSREALEAFPQHLATADKYKNDAYIQQVRQHDKTTADAWHKLLESRDKGLAPNNKPWSDLLYDASGWATIDLPSFWDKTKLGPVNGVVWFRKDIVVPESMVGRPAKLQMGRIVDADSTYINGKLVGSVPFQYPPRKYDVQPGVLKAGKNNITVRVISYSGRGGFIKDKPYSLSSGGITIDLSGKWQYRLGAVMEPLANPTFIEWQPQGLYNAMIAPMLNYSIKGVIWYQGESNTEHAGEYNKTFTALITDWRKQWHEGDFPFLYVQLPNFNEPDKKPSASQWAELREAQLNALRLKNTAMAVTIDIGEWNDIHPLDKQDVGKRLALAARKIAYGEKNIVYSGPMYQSMKIKNNRIILSFTNIGGGLTTIDGKAPGEFAICGPDRQFVWAKARIEGNTITVWNDNISHPEAVRYAWADNPENANVYNKEGLPASPFRTDSYSENNLGQ